MGPLSSQPPPVAAGRWVRLAWWAVAGTSLLLLALLAINLAHGKGTMYGLLNPAGLFCVACGSLLSPRQPRVVLISLGVVLMLASIAMRF